MQLLGVVGGPESFAAPATDALRLSDSDFEVRYFATGPDVLRAYTRGEIDAVIGAEASSNGGVEGGMDALLCAPNRQGFVVVEAALPLGIHLLGRRQSHLDDLTLVLGGGVSMEQARPFLVSRRPAARLEPRSDTLAAAASVAKGDGTCGILGTPSLASRFQLDTLATGLDDGALVNFWVVSARPQFAAKADLAVLVCDDEGRGRLGDVFRQITDRGVRILTAHAHPSAQRLFEYTYVLRVALDPCEPQLGSLATLDAVRVAGAVVRRGGR